MTARDSATGPQQHVPPQAMAPMFPRLRFELPNSLVSELVAQRVSEGARRASLASRRITHGDLAVRRREMGQPLLGILLPARTGANGLWTAPGVTPLAGRTATMIGGTVR